MSDVDELDFTRTAQNDSRTSHYSIEHPGTPPSPPKLATIRTIQDRIERKHRRSVSEHKFSIASWHGNGSKGYIRGRLHKREASEKNLDLDGEREADMESLKGRYSGGSDSLRGFNTGWEYGNHSGPSAYFSDFSPFERTEETPAQLQSTSWRSFSGGHLKQALKRTVKKALSSTRADDDGTTESCTSQSVTAARDSRQRHGERKRYQRHTSTGPEIIEGRGRNDRSTTDSSPISGNVDSDEHVDDNQRKQSRIRASLADLFSRAKRNVSGPSVQEERAIALWYCTLTIRGAQLKEKLSCCVHVYHMEKLISRSEFSSETDHPVWNKKIAFPIKNTHEPLQLKIIEKHRLRSDKLIGRAYIYLRRDEAGCSHEAPINYFSLRKGSSKVLGTLYVDTIVETGFLNSLDDSVIFGVPDEPEMPDELASTVTNGSYTKRHQIHRKIAKKLISHVHFPLLHRPKKRHPTLSSKETLYESAIRIDARFVFSPYEVTRRYLESNGTLPTANVPWQPFLDWPGRRCLELPMMAFQRCYSTRFWELRIPKIPWPIEFLLPMKRLSFPPANLMDSLDVGDTVKVARIVESGIVNIYLVGARGLRAIPQVEMVPSGRLDEKCTGSMSTVGGSMPAGSMLAGSTVDGFDGIVSNQNVGGADVNMVSAETRAASLVALHWAAKSLTLQPSPQIEFTYGDEKKSSCIIKNNSNPDFLEEFEFQVKNGSPGCIRIMVYDRETQPGNSGIQRSSILGETIIDLTAMPLEVTQKLELQLLKNSTEARILMFVTITGLATADTIPVVNHSQITSSPSTASLSSIIQPSRSRLRLNSFDESIRDSQDGPTDAEDRPDLPNLPSNFLQLVAEHFSFKKSFKNFQDIGWMRLKICSAMGLGGKSTNGRIEIFCAIDMFNTHLRTQSIIKRKNPTWNRCFVIPLSDIHAIMKITVVEVEKNKAEVIGGLAIHPLRVDNGGSKWYALKTPDLRGPAKGSILLEANVFFNQFKAALKSFSPMEPRYRSLAKKQSEFRKDYLRLLQQRFEHLKPPLELIRWFGRVLDDWWEWKSPIHSILGLIGYQLLVYYFQPYFIPLYMIIVLMKNCVYSRESASSIIHGLKHNKNAVQLASAHEHEIYKHQYEILEQSAINRARLSERLMLGEGGNNYDSFDYEDAKPESSKLADPQDFDTRNCSLPELLSDIPQEEEEQTMTPSKSEGKKSMRTMYTGIKETIKRICEIVEKTASFYERVEGLFNWRIPWLSSLAVIFLLLLTIILIFVPIKYLFMLWGLNKFTKAILRPNVPRSNEIKEFLSRVPDLIEAVELTEYRPDAFTITPKGKTRKS